MKGIFDMIKIRKTSQNGTAFILVADVEQRRLVVYNESTLAVHHSQTLLEPRCGRLGVQAQRNGALYFEINASEVDDIRAGYNRQRRSTDCGVVIDSEYVRQNYVNLPVTRDAGRARTRRQNTTPTVAPVSNQPTVAPVSNQPTVAPVSNQPTVAPVSGNHQQSVFHYRGGRAYGFIRDQAIENGDKLGMGIELEIVHPQGDTPTTRQAVLQAVRDSGFTMADCHVERDSTVTFEIIFNAFTIEKWREIKPKLKELCRLLTAAGFQSEQGGRCGLHTHISRKYLKENGDALIYRLHMNNAEFFKKLSRRNEYRWCEFRISDLNNLLSDKETGNDHQVAINNGNPHTVELRYWRGTLNVTRIMQQLEFIQQLVDAVNARDSFETLFVCDSQVLASWFTGAAREYIHHRNAANVTRNNFAF